MADHATPNLPSRSFDATIGFYKQLGFGTSWHDKGWLILKRGNIALEFFPYPDLEPADSSFGCCIRLDNLEEFYSLCLDANISVSSTGFPRITPPKIEHSGMKIAYMVDPDGTLLRLIQNI